MTGKRKLVMALTAVLALTGGASGQAAFSNTLDEVIVTAEKDRKYCLVVSKEKKPLSD